MFLDFENRERQTKGEEIANSIIHGVGGALSIAALVLLVVFAVRWGGARHVVSYAIYGSTLVILYILSTLYHAIQEPDIKNFLEILDHCAVYLLIAGTYTPFTLVVLKGGWGWSLFGVVWGLTVIGVVLKFYTIKKMVVLSTLIYIAMGWICIVAIKQIVAALAPAGVFWLVLGGMLYSLGTIFYIWRKVLFHHAIWHVFVLAGSACHFFCILLYVTKVRVN